MTNPRVAQRQSVGETSRRPEVRVLTPRTNLKRWSGAWHQKLGSASPSYLTRWFAETPWFSIRLHHWRGDDDQRAEHDHPWNALVILLWGGYIEAMNTRRALTVYTMKAEHRHAVKLISPHVWSLVLTGPVLRRWGFWVRGRKWVRARRYFFQHGHH